jgi:hypothetical protein
MARLTIDTGTLGNTATGDSLRGAFTKVNTNFEELYAELGSSGILSDLSFAGNTISTDGTNQNLILDPNGTGKVIIEGTVDLGGLSIASQTITGLTTNSNITLSPAGTGAVDVDTSRIINVSDPSSAQDAATKNYVDTQLAGSDHNFTFVGDDSSGTAVTQGETFKFAGTQNITTAVSGDTLTITGPDLSSYATTSYVDAQNQSQALTFVGDDSTGTAVNSGETFKIAGTQNITTAVSGDTLTITGPDLSNYLQNTGTQTIDNLSFNDNIISTSSNADLILDPGGTGDVRINTDKISLGNQAGQTTQGAMQWQLVSAGYTTQGASAVAVGNSSGETTQGDYAVALGYNAGTTSQGGSATAVGDSAGQTTQGAGAVAVGVYAGNTSQGASAVAVGNLAGNTSQGGYAVAVGNLAGQSTQGINAVAIGDTAGQTNQGASAIAIGKEAGHTNQAANSIVINATNSQLNNTTADALIIKPIRRRNF